VTSFSVARIPIAIFGAPFVTEFSKQVGFTLLTPLCIVIGNVLIQTIPSYTEHNLQFNELHVQFYVHFPPKYATTHSLQIPALFSHHLSPQTLVHKQHYTIFSTTHFEHASLMFSQKNVITIFWASCITCAKMSKET
jgi:hypothetical protein